MTTGSVTAVARCEARTQYRIGPRQDAYARTVIEQGPDALVVTICGPDDLICESRRITNTAVLAYIQWHLETVADLTRRIGA